MVTCSIAPQTEDRIKTEPRRGPSTTLDRLRGVTGALNCQAKASEDQESSPLIRNAARLPLSRPGRSTLTHGRNLPKFRDACFSTSWCPSHFSVAPSTRGMVYERGGGGSAKKGSTTTCWAPPSVWGRVGRNLRSENRGDEAESPWVRGPCFGARAAAGLKTNGSLSCFLPAHDLRR